MFMPFSYVGVIPKPQVSKRGNQKLDRPNSYALGLDSCFRLRVTDLSPLDNFHISQLLAEW